MTSKPSKPELAAELEDLRARLAEAEEVLRAIRNGDVDAVVVAGGRGEQVYTLSGADRIYRQLIEAMSEGAVTLSADGIIQYANQTFARLLQTPLERVIGAEFRAFVSPADQPVVADLIEAAWGGSSRGEVSVRVAGGSFVPLRLGLSRMQLDPETLVCMVATDLTGEKKTEAALRGLYADLEKRVEERTADLAASRLAALNMMEDEVDARKVAEVTNRDLQREMVERKQAEAALREEEMRYRTLFGQSPDGVLIIDTQTGLPILFNDFTFRQLGYTREEFARLRINDYEAAENPEVTQARMEKILREGREDFETKHRTKTGDLRNVLVTVQTVELSGQPVFHCIYRDITERKRAEAEILELNSSLERRVAERTQQLEEASRAKSDFLANMSHELRTPLNSIIGFSEMLKDGVLGELDAKRRGFVADIFGAGTHLLSLINDILDLSKVEAGMLQLEPGAVDVAALLKASTMIVREKAAAHRIRLDTRLDPALGTMLADERKLKQIVYNLLSNAVKFTPEGGAVTLRARRCARAEVALDEVLPGRLVAPPSGEANEFLAITVEDSGIGIAEEHLPKLFEPFVQVDSSAARRQGGTGLGLSLVRRLAELHGGTVGVASRPGAGSRFCVWLPYREAAPAVPEGRTMPEGAAPSASLALVIEDDDRMADLITAQLRAEGFEVMRAATAEEGLVRAAKCKLQLITLDIFLPAMDGWEFMRRLKADPKLADTPVVIITVSEDLARGLALGAGRVLQKPFVREELVAALAGLIDARPDGEPARVLVVDDNVKAVELLATALEAEGYRVLRAYGGAEAIEVARSARPDLVILDLVMPGVSGFEVARALRESEHTARIPILVLTAKDLTAEDHARLNGDVSAILAKASFSTSELLAELRRALPKRAGD